jgi:hypothetical protein
MSVGHLCGVRRWIVATTWLLAGAVAWPAEPTTPARSPFAQMLCSTSRAARGSLILWS